MAPGSALKDLLLIQGEVVGAVLLQLVSIMSMSNEEYLQHSLGVDELFEVAGADFHQSVEHEEVSEDQQLDEELCLLFLDVEVVRVDVLDDAGEVGLGHSCN